MRSTPVEIEANIAGRLITIMSGLKSEWRDLTRAFNPLGWESIHTLLLKAREGNAAQHLLGDLWVGTGATTIAVDGDALPKKLDLDLVRVIHDIAYNPFLFGCTLYRGQYLRMV